MESSITEDDQKAERKDYNTCFSEAFIRQKHAANSAEWTSCSACHELLCSRAFLFIVLRSARHPQIPRFLQIFRGIWPMPLSLLNHSALALFAQRTRIPTSARSIGFCAISVCISSSSSSIESLTKNFGSWLVRGKFDNWLYRF